MGKKKFISFLLSASLLFSIGMPQMTVKAEDVADEETATVISAADEKYQPDKEHGDDWSVAIQSMIEDAKEIEGPVILDFPKDTYNLYPDQAYHKELYISNTVGANASYKNKNIGFLLEEMEDVTIEGNGSLFLFHGNMTTFATIDSTNITFQNYEFDFADPSVVDITVESVEGNSAIISVPQDYNYEINGTSIRWKSSVSPYTGQTYWTANNALANVANQIYDASTDLTVRASTPLFNSLSSIEDLGGRKLKFTYNGGINSSIKKGLTYEMRNTTRDHSGMFFWKSKNVKLKDVGVHFLYGFGIVGQHSENITLDGVKFEEPEDSGRKTVGFADFVQISGCKGEIRIENCSFSNPHDDPINVHGTFNEVVERISDNKIRVQFKHNETAGFPNFFVGDEIQFVEKSNMCPVENFTAKVTEIDGPDGTGGRHSNGSLTDITLTLDKEIPAGIPGTVSGNTSQYVIENITYTPSVVIQNNIFKRVPTRGILCTTSRPVVIKDNVFDGMGMASIFLESNSTSWYESGGVRDMTIEGNTFIRSTASYPVIYIEPTGSANKEKTVHRNIKNRDNVFYMLNGKVFTAKSTSGISFTGNQIYRYDPEVKLSLKASSDILREGNTIQLAASGTAKTLTSDLYSFNGSTGVVIADNIYDDGLKLNATTGGGMTDSDIDVSGEENLVVNGPANQLPAISGVTYVSSDKSILQIDENGVARGLKAGEVEVKACVKTGPDEFVYSEGVTITVTEKAETGNNTYLNALEPGDGLELEYVYGSGGSSYTGIAGKSNVSLDLSAEEQDAVLEVFLDGESIGKGTGSLKAQIPIYSGSNKVYVRITSPNGKKEQVYDFTITGQAECYLSDLDYIPEKSSTGDGNVVARKDKSHEGNSIRLLNADGDVQTFEKGIGSHATCEIVYNIADLGYTNFSTYVGIDREITNENEPDVKFYIYGDGIELASTDTMTFTTPMQKLSVSVAGVKELKLKADKIVNNWSDHVDFADAKFTSNIPEKTVNKQTVRYNVSLKSGSNVSASTTEGSTTNGFIGVVNGEDVTLRAEIKEGYTFVGWYDAKGDLCGTDATLTVTNVTEDLSYTAKIEAESKADLETVVGNVNESVTEEVLNKLTEDTKKAYLEALAAANSVLNNPEATKEEVEEALKKLNAAVEGMTEKGDNSSLEAAIAEAKKLNVSGYTSSSVAVYKAALDEAERVAAASTSQAEINAALTKLQNAIKGLVLDKGATFTANGFICMVTDASAANGTVSIQGLAEKAKKSMAIPPTVSNNGVVYKVTAIAKGAFQKNKTVTKVTVGENIVSIGSNAFNKCNKLKTIIFKGTTVPKIEKQAFKGIKKNCKIQYSKKMKAKQLKKLKKAMKKGGAGSKVSYKKK